MKPPTALLLIALLLPVACREPCTEEMGCYAHEHPTPWVPSTPWMPVNHWPIGKDLFYELPSCLGAAHVATEDGRPFAYSSVLRGQDCTGETGIAYGERL